MRRLLAPVLVLLLAAASGMTEEEPVPPQTQPSDSGAHHEGHDHDATMTHSFADVEHWVSVFEDPNRAAWQKPEAVPGILGLRPGDVVADIGAGTGYFNRYLARAVGEAGKVYAADVEPTLVEYMKQRAVREATPQVLAVLAKPDDPLLPAAGVDVIFICNTWHHIDDRLAYLGRLRHALKPSGRLAIVDFQKRELPVGPPPEHKLTRDEVVAELAEAGWELRTESDALPYQYTLIFTPRAAPR